MHINYENVCIDEFVSVKFDLYKLLHSLYKTFITNLVNNPL